MRAIQVFDGDGVKVRPKAEWPIMLNAQVFAGDKGIIQMRGVRYRYQITRAKPGDEWPNEQLAVYVDGVDKAGLFSQGIGDARFTEHRVTILPNGGARSYLAFINFRRGELAALIQEHCIY